MANIEDYILWRGDIPFTVSDFNEADALILCQLSYIDFDGIVSENFKSGITIKEAAQKYALRNPKKDPKDFGVFINPRSARLLEAAGNSVRFSGIVLKGFVNEIDLKAEKQFSAVTAVLSPKKSCVVYRGTDDTLIGWKEDFNMAADDPVPSQQAALDYLEKACIHCRGKLYTAGHSKGGNLALYAPAFCSDKIFKRIETIFCFDGPGFNKDTCRRGDTARAFAKAQCFVPQSSVVGILLEYPKKHTVVQSDAANGVLQHDAFSWQFHGKEFATLSKRGDDSMFAENTVKTWLEGLDKKARKEFINTLFDAAGAAGALTLTDLKNRWVQTSAAALKKLHDTDSKTKERIFAILKLFVKSVQSNMPAIGDLLNAKSGQHDKNKNTGRKK